VAYLVIFFELSCGLLLALGMLVPVAAWTASTLLTMFGIAMSINLLRDDRHPCGCFGAGAARLVSWPLVIRNLLLAVLGVAVALLPVAGFTVAGPAVDTPRVISASDGLALLITVLAGVMVVRLTAALRRLARAQTQLAILSKQEGGR
jgi:hypothetical protein